MKNKTFLAVFLAAVLSLGVTGISFARGGMGGGFSGSRESFHSSRQGMSGPSGGQSQQDRIRNRENIQHRDRDQDRYRNGDRDRGETGAPATGNPQGQDGFQGGSDGNRYGQQDGAANAQGESHRATPATPAQPGAPGEAATPAIPATPAGN